MGKLIQILAASVGGGLVLGASIRLGEALGSSAIAARRQAEGPDRARRLRPARRGLGMAENAAGEDGPAIDPFFAARLERLEEKLGQANSRPQRGAGEPDPELRNVLAGVVTRIERQQAEVETMRSQVAKAARAMDTVAGITESLRQELHERLSRELDERLAGIEESFHVSMEAANRRSVDAMLSSIETRVAPRIVQLETDVAGQSAAVTELRDCAVQSERSLQRLLGVLERVMHSSNAESGGPPEGGREGGLHVADATGPEASRSEAAWPEAGKAASGGRPAQQNPAGVSGEARRPLPFRSLNPVI